jgi:hypothetical protein
MIFCMFPFCLYFVAGVVTGFHVCTLLALAVYGIPFNPLELTSLFGSLCLLVAAFVSLFKPYMAGRLALLACLAIWGFYGPATARLIRTNFHHQSSESGDLVRLRIPEGTCSNDIRANAKADSFRRRRAPF